MRVDRATRVIRAAPAVIYRAFATADALVAWIAPQGMTASVLGFDFREGGSYRKRLTYKSADHSRGKTTDSSDEVEVRVAFTSERPEFSGDMRLRWTFEGLGEGTRVTVRCENVPAGIYAPEHDAGLRSSLDNLAAFAER